MPIRMVEIYSTHWSWADATDRPMRIMLRAHYGSRPARIAFAPTGFLVELVYEPSGTCGISTWARVAGLCGEGGEVEVVR